MPRAASNSEQTLCTSGEYPLAFIPTGSDAFFEEDFGSGWAMEEAVLLQM